MKNNLSFLHLSNHDRCILLYQTMYIYILTHTRTHTNMSVKHQEDAVQKEQHNIHNFQNIPIFSAILSHSFLMDRTFQIQNF